MKQIRVMIVDDHSDFRRVVHEFLRRLPNVFVVAEASDGREAVAKVEELHPDVVLMDIAMPNVNGLEATRIIKSKWPETRVMIATMHDNPIYRLQALEAKADAFVLKTSLKPALEREFSMNGKGGLQTSVAV